jgi:hypothetical protein
MPMHPASERALRELTSAVRQLCEHWSMLAGRLAGPEAVVLRPGADSAAELLSELGAAVTARGVEADPSADAPSVRPRPTERLVERNQALRSAVLDVQHVTTLLAYLEPLARNDGDAELGEFCARWQGTLWAHENAVRGLAIAAAEDPDHAIAPADGSPVERAAARGGR